MTVTVAPSNRRVTPLKEVADLIMGQSPPGSTYNEVGDGIPFFQGVRDFGARYPSPRVFCTAPSRIAQPGDLLLSVRAPIGRTNIADRECAAGRGLAIIRCRRRSDRRYLEFVLRHLEPTWEVLEGSGSVFGNATKKDIESLLLPWHRDAAERGQIARILGALDDKIELNRRMNATLEAMARALFESWFVDFDPVRAKMEDRDPGLPKHIADLFPDRLVASELGEIPEGWSLLSLPELIDVNPRRRLRKGMVAPYLAMANMPTRGHVPDSVGDRPYGSGVRFANGDTLVARITPCLENGKIAFVDFLGDGEIGWGSTEYIVLQPKPPIPAEFAYCLARSPRFRRFAVHNMSGTSGRQRVPAAALLGFRMAVPEVGIVGEFGCAARSLLARASANAAESRTVGRVRDTMLSKLVAGAVRVTGPEALDGGNGRSVSSGTHGV